MKIKHIFLLFILILPLALIYPTVVVYGDSRSQPEIHRQIINQLIKFAPNAVFHTGDMVAYGLRQTEYDELHAALKPITNHSKFYPVIGNHERNIGLYFKNFPELNNQNYYTATEDSMVFIILDSTIKLGPGSPQYKWLQATLEQNKQKPMIVLMHHPVFSSGEHGDELGLAFFLPALLAKYPVLAVFSGHDHMYERSLYGKQWYIVTGGGGAPLYNANSRNDRSKKIYLGYNFCVLDYKNSVLTVKVYIIDGKLLEEFSSDFIPVATPAAEQPK
jgi:3',5'-cyclic AMP phosphodiesterase CpdA